MNLSFQTIGSKQVTKALLSMERRTANATIKGSIDAARFVHKRAVEWAPEDTGTLKGSLKKGLVKKMFGAVSSVYADATDAQRQAALGSGEPGLDKSYALAAHELPRYRKKGARPRFLAKALDESHMEIMDAFNQQIARIPGIGTIL